MKLWLRNILILWAVGIAAALGCPIYELTGITCPLCGTTRAWLAFFRGDFALAFTCHPLFLLIPPWFLGVLLWDGPLKNKKWAQGLLIGFAGVLFAMNVLRWMGIVPLPV